MVAVMTEPAGKEVLEVTVEVAAVAVMGEEGTVEVVMAVVMVEGATAEEAMEVVTEESTAGVVKAGELHTWRPALTFSVIFFRLTNLSGDGSHHDEGVENWYVRLGELTLQQLQVVRPEKPDVTFVLDAELHEHGGVRPKPCSQRLEPFSHHLAHPRAPPRTVGCPGSVSAAVLVFSAGMPWRGHAAVRGGGQGRGAGWWGRAERPVGRRQLDCP